MKTNFQDFKNMITIAEVAERLGYKLTSSQNAKHLEYQLRAGASKMDEIVIYRNNIQTFFSRGIGDKGDLIDFIKNRVNMFPNAVGEGFEAVYDILSKMTGNIKVRSQHIFQQPVAEHNFDKSKYNITCKRNVIYGYLGKTRGLSFDVITDFLNIQSIYTVAKANQPGNYSNVAFPFVELANPKEIVNFELRNFNSYTNTPYKGFCTGGNKSSACWIASFADNWNKVKNLYIGESAIDMMSLYQMLDKDERKDSAFISVGGNLVIGQIKNIRNLFPNAIIHLAFDNDAMGNLYDVIAAHFLVQGAFVRGYKHNDEVVVALDNTQHIYKAQEFNSLCYLITNNIYPGWLHIYKAVGAKDFNDMLNLNRK